MSARAKWTGRVSTLAAFFLLIGSAPPAAEQEASVYALPADIHSIGVRMVENKTEVQNVDNLRLAIVNQLIQDRRTPYADDEKHADGVIIPKLKYYRNTAIGQGVSGVANEFEMWVILDASFFDNKTGELLWTQPNFQRKATYVSESERGGKSEEAEQQELWTLFAADIVKRTVDGPGGIDSLTPRAVPRLPGESQDQPAQ